MEIALFGIILLLIAVIAWRLWKPQKEQPKEDSQALLMLQNQLHELKSVLDARLQESAKSTLAQTHENAKLVVQIIDNVRKELAQVTEGQKQIVSLNDQLKNLNDVLKNTKTRGILGEYLLENVLKNILPPGHYQLQYPFKNGDKVDAVIFYQEKIIPIDSKFSLENYNRYASANTDDEKKRYEDALRSDLKTRIEETSKYIKPSENTVDFAFMFIPHEALYYDLLVNKVGVAAGRDLIQYAAEKRVFVVSPTTFYVYLNMVSQGIRQNQIQQSAQEIIKGVGELQKHLERYEEYFEKIGTHLQTTQNAYATAQKEFGKIDKDILKLASSEEESGPERLL